MRRNKLLQGEKPKRKISRYIYVPFILGASNALLNYLLLAGSLNHIIWNFVSFVLFGFAILLYNDYRIGKLTSKDNDEAYKVRQKRNIVLFTNYDRAFDLCLESIDCLKKARLTNKNRLQGTIKAKTGINWRSFGTKINFKLSKLTEFSTEIELCCEPLVRTTLVDYGECFKAAEELCKFFDEKNNELNKKVVEAKTSIPIEFYSASKKAKAAIE